jgi:Protein kinase domain
MFKRPSIALEEETEEPSIMLGETSDEEIEKERKANARKLAHEIMNLSPSCSYPLKDLARICNKLFPLSKNKSRYQSILDWDRAKVIGRGAFGSASLVPIKGRHGDVVVKQIILQVAEPNPDALLREFLFATYAGELGVGPKVYDAWIGSCIKPNEQVDDKVCFYMVMESLKGKTLKALRRCPTAFEWDLILNAIAKLHDHNIVHGDFYSRNIIFIQDAKGKTSNIKIIDYGLAKFDESRTAKMSELIISDLNEYCARSAARHG